MTFIVCWRPLDQVNWTGAFFAFPSCIALRCPPPAAFRAPSYSVSTDGPPNMAEPVFWAVCYGTPLGSAKVPPLLVGLFCICSIFWFMPAFSLVWKSALDMLTLGSFTAPALILFLASSFYTRLAYSLASASLIFCWRLKMRSSVESISRYASSCDI